MRTTVLGRLWARGGRAGRGRGLKHGREGGGRHGGLCRNRLTGLEVSYSLFLRGKLSSIIMEIKEEIA